MREVGAEWDRNVLNKQAGLKFVKSENLAAEYSLSILDASLVKMFLEE